MIYIFLSLIFFLISIVIHLLFCHQFKIKVSSVKLFFRITFVNLLTMFLLFDVLPLSSLSDPLRGTAVFIYLLLIPIYLYAYYKINSETPSKKIYDRLQDNPHVNYKEFLMIIEKESFVERSLEDLIKNGYVRKRDGKYFLTPMGRFFSLFIKADRYIF